MTAVDKGLLTDVLDVLNGMHQFLLQDLANERLSQGNVQKKNYHINVVDGLIHRIQSIHPSIRPRMNTPGKPPSFQPPPSFKPPLPPPSEDQDQQEVYEVPQNADEQTTELQEEYLAMEGDEGRIEEETYEDPSQTPQDQPQELYEETLPITLDAPPISVSSPPSTTARFEPAGYMDPLALHTEPISDNHRASVVPVDLIGDWEEAYDTSTNKKKEKLKISDLKNITFRGNLEKLGGRNQKSWQKRYCVLADAFLYFYEKESANTYNNRIPIFGFSSSPADELTKPKKNQFAFKLTAVSGPLKDYYFRTKTQAERDGWVQSLMSNSEKARMNVADKRKSTTLPPSMEYKGQKSTPTPPPPAVIELHEEQENYEALEPVIAETQDNYVDVNMDGDEPQEDYVELEPNQLNKQEEIQEDYIEPQQFRGHHMASSPHTPSSSSSFTPRMPLPAEPRPDPFIDTSKVYTQKDIDLAKVYVLLWDFKTGEPDELSVMRGQLVLVKDPKSGQDWWYGELLDDNASKRLGPSGLFPANYSSNAFETIPS